MEAAFLEGKWMPEYAKPTAAFVIRFSGAGLTHLGKAVDAALERLLDEVEDVSYRGFLTSGAKQTRYAAPKPTVGAGRATLTKALAGQKTFPNKDTNLYFCDVARGEGLLPDQFAAYLGLETDHKGVLTCSFPLEALEDARWLAVVDELVVLLAAEVAWMGPAVWLAPPSLFNSSLNRLEAPAAYIELFARDPHVDVPSLYTSEGWPLEDLEPGPFAGFVAPAWVMWAGAALAKRVKTYGGETAKLHGGATRYHMGGSPFEMTETSYARWNARWAELAPLHVTASENTIARYVCHRFGAKSLAAHTDAWRDADRASAAREKRLMEISVEFDKLARRPGPTLLAYADSVVKEMNASNASYFLPGLRALVEAGTATPAEAHVWLDVCEQMNSAHLYYKMAEVAAAAGDATRAIDLLHRGLKAGAIASKPELKRTPDFKTLRKDPRFKKLVG